MDIKRIAAAVMSCVIAAGAGVSGGLSPVQVLAAGKTRVSVHDPSIIKANDGTYYVFGSHIDAARTGDLQNWRTFTNGYARTNNVEFGDLSANLKKAFDWAGEDLEDCVGGFAVWAPDVVWNKDYINADGSKGAYLMYFCTSSTYMRSVIGFAASKNIEGPYTFVDTLIYSGFTSGDSYAKSSTKNVNRKYTSTNIDELIAAGEVTYNNSWFTNGGYNNQAFPNAIDPTIYYDTDGKMYMVYGSWSGGIFTLQIDPSTGRCIHPKSGRTADGRLIDSYFGTKLAGGFHKSGEGPFIEYNPDTGYYYLWETYGGLFSEGGYNMRVFRSTSPTGPFTDPAGRSGIMEANSDLDSTGLKVMGNYKFSSLNKAYMACGHNSVLKDDDGRWYLFYHARFDDGTEYHEVRVHSMYFNAEGWPVVSPFEYSGDAMSANGYETADIAGDYEYIDHGNSTDGKIIGSQKVTLSADGKITGAVTGTWSQAEDSAEAVLNIGGQKYSGYFLAAHDESGRKVMTFTAVGSNNRTVWGAKTAAYAGKDREGGIVDYTDKNSSLINNADTASGGGKSVYIGDTGLLSGVSYYITNKNSGKVIDLPNGVLDAGTNIQQWEYNGLFAQQWRIIDEGDGWCRIVALGDESKCIAAASSSGDDGVNIELQTYNGTDAQLWKLVRSGMSYGIVSKCSGGKSGLDVYEWSTKDGGNINQWNYWEGDCQLWELSPVYPSVNSGTYAIRSLSSGKYLSIADGKAVQSGERSVFTLTTNSDGSCGISCNGAAIGVHGGTSEVVSGTDSELRIICNKDGSYSVLTGEKSAFDASGQTEICQSEYSGADSQKFIFEPVVYENIPEETTVPTEATTETEIVWGDVNGDGRVTLADSLAVLQFIANEDKYPLDDRAKRAADVYECGGGITAMDSISIQRYDVGAIDKLPESYK